MSGPIGMAVPSRKRPLWGWAIGILLGALVGGLALARATASHTEVEIPAQVRHIEGEVTANGHPTREGEMVSVGDLLETGANARATLALVSDGALRLAPATRLAMKTLVCHGMTHDVWIELSRGRAWVDGRHGCNACLRTGHGSIRPEAACYDAMDAPEETTVWVWRGRVVVSSADEPNIGVSVESGQWAKIFRSRVNLGLIRSQKSGVRSQEK